MKLCPLPQFPLPQFRLYSNTTLSFKESNITDQGIPLHGQEKPILWIIVLVSWAVPSLCSAIGLSESSIGIASRQSTSFLLKALIPFQATTITLLLERVGTSLFKKSPQIVSTEVYVFDEMWNNLPLITRNCGQWMLILH